MAGLGYDIFLSPFVAFEIKGVYNYIKQTEFAETNTVGINFGFQFFLNRN